MFAWRSLLFVPGDRPDRIARAHSRGADAIIIDLEDSVALSEKMKARAALPAGAAALREAGADVIVRINVAWRLAFADIEAAVAANASALIIPKTDDPARLQVISGILSELEAERGMADGTVRLIALIEFAGSALATAGHCRRGAGIGTRVRHRRFLPVAWRTAYGTILDRALPADRSCGVHPGPDVARASYFNC